jgi:hypothetical protein
MNKRNLLSILVLGFLVSSIITSDLSKGAVASDQLEINKGSYVKGEYLITNNTHTNEFIWKIDIEIEKSIKPRGSSNKFDQIKISQYDFANDEMSPVEGMDRFERTQLVFNHNRTTLLLAARIFVSNSSYSVEISTLHHSNFADIMNGTKARITYGNGTEYDFESVSPTDPEYSELSSLVSFWTYYNTFMLAERPWTIHAISPKAQIGDTITFDEAFGDVIDTPDLIFLNLGTYNSIQVQYVNTTCFFTELFLEVEVFYESKTGLMIRSVEDYPPANVTLLFIPNEINIKSNNLGLIIGISVAVVVVLTIIVVIYFKKK